MFKSFINTQRDPSKYCKITHGNYSLIYPKGPVIKYGERWGGGGGRKNSRVGQFLTPIKRGMGRKKCFSHDEEVITQCLRKLKRELEVLVILKGGRKPPSRN